MAPSTVIRAAAANGIGIGRVEPAVLELAAAPLDRVRDEAVRSGYEEGRRIAAEEAAAASKRAAAEREKRIAAALAFLENAALVARAQASEELDRLAKSATSLALALTETILQRELELSSNPGAEAIERALAFVPGDAPAVARCNPADLALLDGVTSPSITLVADPEIGRGGCILDTSVTFVDARIETAISRVRALLEQAGCGRDE